MNKNILFYSSVKNMELFNTQKFYSFDIKILRDINNRVETTNRIWDFFKIKSYDIAFIYFYRLGFFCGLIAKLLGKKVYFTGGIDDLDKSYSSPKNHFIQKVFFKLCYLVSDKCIIVSSSDMKNVKRVMPKSNLSKIYISMHAIDISPYENVKTTLSKRNYMTTIAWMESKGNVIRKGVDKALELFSYLKKNYLEFKDYKFLIIGKKGEGSQYLYNLIEKLEIENDVIFLGVMEEEEKVKILFESKIYMQLSKYEGFGLAAAEALATHNIVINSGKGGLIDSVGKYGVICDIDNNLLEQLPSIFHGIQTIDDEFLKNGKNYVIENFSFEKRKDDFIKIIN